MTLFPTIFTIRRVVKKLIRPLLIPTQVTVDTMGTIKGLTKGCERVPFEGLIACSFQIWRDFRVFFCCRAVFCVCMCVMVDLFYCCLIYVLGMCVGMYLIYLCHCLVFVSLVQRSGRDS